MNVTILSIQNIIVEAVKWYCSLLDKSITSLGVKTDYSHQPYDDTFKATFASVFGGILLFTIGLSTLSIEFPMLLISIPFFLATIVCGRILYLVQKSTVKV